MRNSLVIATVSIVAVSLYSCTRELEVPMQRSSADENLQVIVLNAALESKPATRTSRHSDGKIYWSPGDEISLFYGSGENGGSKFTSLNTTDELTAQFSGNINVVTLGGEGSSLDDISFWGIYPYRDDNSCDGSSITTTLPDHQTAKADTFDDDLFISMGKSFGLNIAFYNLCSGIKFTVSHPNISRIELSGNNNEPLAGKVKVGFDENGKPVIQSVLDGKTTITLDAPNGGTFAVGATYYIVTLPVPLTASMKMTFIQKDGNTATRRWSSQNITFSRNVFKTYTPIDDSQYVTFMETVDLGLSSGTLWATCNLGAAISEAAGNYYAWGELAPRTSNYGTANSDISAKYQNSALPKLEPEDDAAYYLMGGDWRLPTVDQINELKSECLWRVSTLNGVSGFIVLGPNGNSIFIPACGTIRSGTNVINPTQTVLWSSSKYDDTPKAYVMSIYPSGTSNNVSRDVFGQGGNLLAQGLSIRPVRPHAIIRVSCVEIEGKHAAIPYTSTTLTAKFTPEDATNQHVTWSSSDETIATVSQDGVVSAKKTGTVVISATPEDGGDDKRADFNFYVSVQPLVVNLGLPSGTKWAQWDIGSNGAGTIGWLFNDGRILPEYSNDVETGDAAEYFYGSGWAVPTASQMQELIDNCTWEYYSGYLYPNAGWKATSKIEGHTNASVFFPISSETGYSGFWTDFIGGPDPHYQMLNYYLILYLTNESNYGLERRYFEYENYSAFQYYVRAVKNE